MKRRVRKYHTLKDFDEYSHESSDDDEELFDMSNPELLKERIHLYLNLKRLDTSIRFKDKSDQFILEIKGREGMRQT